MSDYNSKVTISSNDKSYCPPPPPPTCPSTCLEQDFVLSDGANVHVQPGKEVNQDFTLVSNPFANCGTISGLVRDTHGRPIKNALVKVFDEHHKPVTHVFTNDEGQYLICLSPGKYIVKAVR